MSQIVVMNPEEVAGLVQAAVLAAMSGMGGPTPLDALKKKELLTPQEVETLYGLDARTLCNKRGQGRGPAYVQEDKGAAVFYRHQDVQNYIQACRRKTYDASGV